MSETEVFSVCERCGVTTNAVYPITLKNDYGEPVELKVCWGCDHDIINGADPFADSNEVFQDHMELAHAYDPINTEPLW